MNTSNHIYSRWAKAVVLVRKCWTVVFLHNKFSWHSNISVHLWRLTGLESAGEGGVTVWIESRQGIVTQQERALALESRPVCFFLYQSSHHMKKNYLESQRWCWRQLCEAAKLSAGMCQAEGWNLNPSPIIPTSVSRSTSHWTKSDMPAQFSRIAAGFFMFSKMKFLKQVYETEQCETKSSRYCCRHGMIHRCLAFPSQHELCLLDE